MAETATNLNDAPNANALPELVRSYERRLDEALAAYGEIMSALPRARVELKLSAVVGHGVLSHFVDSGAAVVAARGHSVKAHRLADRVTDALGLVYAAGDETPKPNDPQRFFTTGEAPASVEA